MDFDTDFDYSRAIVSINERIAVLTTQIDHNSNKSLLLQASSYASIISNELNELSNTIARDTLERDNYIAILGEIQRIQSLSTEDKSLIYYFYTVMGINKIHYMVKLLFNTEELVNPNVIAVYTDQITSAEVKLMVARILYEQFSISNLYPEIQYIRSYL